MSIQFAGEGKIYMNLKALSLKGIGSAKTEIGFDTPYAARIHEDLQMNHPNGGEAKYLEKAYRRNLAYAKQYIKQYLMNTKDLKAAIVAGSYIILREAQRIVPVDTGRLRDSGYVKVSTGLG